MSKLKTKMNSKAAINALLLKANIRNICDFLDGWKHIITDGGPSTGSRTAGRELIKFK